VARDIGVTAFHIAQAAEAIKGIALRTPVLSSPVLDRLAGRRVFIKAESQQRTGSFKFRSAYHALRREQASRTRLRGVVASSSGNYARALATAARLLKVKAAVVMAANAPAVKLQGAASLGAEVVTYDPDGPSGEVIAAKHARTHGLVVLNPAGTATQVAGAGTAAWELCRQVSELAALFVPVGGGALAAGSAVAAQAQFRKTRVIGVEPVAANDTQRSMDAGRRLVIPAPQTVADDLRHTRPDVLPFTIIHERLDDVVTVSEEAIADAMGLLYLHLRTIAEPSGAVALAALLTPGIRVPRGPVGVMLSGGNVDWESYRSLLDPAMARITPRRERRTTARRARVA
jgi:threonine dehydratase